jgi:hypothetical protein
MFIDKREQARRVENLRKSLRTILDWDGQEATFSEAASPGI